MDSLTGGPARGRSPCAGARETVRRRPIDAGDEPFLRLLYGTTRDREMTLVDWDPKRKEEFLDWQFRAQHEYYLRTFAGAEFSLVLAGPDPIGRLYVERTPDEIRIIDMALLPHWRRRGIGTALLSELIGEARERCVPLRLRVEPDNPARRLYERLGFRPIAHEEVNLHMEWHGDVA